MRTDPFGREAAIIGTVVDEHRFAPLKTGSLARRACGSVAARIDQRSTRIEARSRRIGASAPRNERLIGRTPPSLRRSCPGTRRMEARSQRIERRSARIDSMSRRISRPCPLVPTPCGTASVGRCRASALPRDLLRWKSVSSCCMPRRSSSTRGDDLGPGRPGRVLPCRSPECAGTSSLDARRCRLDTPRESHERIDELVQAEWLGKVRLEPMREGELRVAG